MATAEDILFWTKYTVTEDAAARYTTAAQARLDLDGGSAVPDDLRTQLVCYLAGDMIATGAREDTSCSEHIGDYSYTTSSTPATADDYWLKKYRTLLSACTAAACTPSSGNGGIVERTVDRHMVGLFRQSAGKEPY